ncbi:MFS transporter [Trinickia symbiotica]|uniref:MFS transporter n=1 Tax=Trinickia symbiotica TaxID=863227 RepID=A0A2T3XLD0_9BURK|nr:MFS transporter [Trinickia symbiotica]PTB17334.1 MFS transporter [Trinickia symbiotica]
MDDRTTVTQAAVSGASIPNLRWTVLIWLLLGGIINYLDRASLSIAAPEMIHELGLTRTDIGLLGTVFAWTYAVMQLPAGWIVDRFGAKRAYALGMIWWSVATYLTGVVGALSGLIVMRVLLAVGEAPCWPTAAKITSIWFPGKERSFATGIWDSSSKWGPALAPALLIALMVAFGWRALFHVTGIAGIAFALVFMVLYRNPRDSKRLSRAEFDHIEAGGGGHERALGRGSHLAWGALFKQRSVWGMIFGYFCAIWLWNLFLVFLPLYLLDRFHVTFAQLGVYAAVPWVGGALGEIAGGYLTKKLVDRQIASPMGAKRAVLVVCALLAGACAITLPFIATLNGTLVATTLGLACIAATIGSAWAMAADIAPPKLVASVCSIQNFGGYFGGAFSPVVAGYLVDHTGSYALALTSGGIIAAFAALFYGLMVRRPVPAIEPGASEETARAPEVAG